MSNFIQGWTIQRLGPNSSKWSWQSGSPSSEREQNEATWIFFQERLDCVICHDIKPHDQLSQRVGKECRWDEGHDPHPGRGVKARARREAFDPGVMRSRGGNWEGKQLTPGWDERFSGTSWWSEGSSLPKAAGTIQTNWSLLAASMQAPHLNRPPSLRLTPLRGFSTCE